MMKKLLALVVVIILSMTTLLGCQNKKTTIEDTTTIKVAALKGPTAMGMVKMMDDAKTTKNYEFQTKAAIDEITPLLVKGDVDIAAVPANLLLYCIITRKVK